MNTTFDESIGLNTSHTIRNVIRYLTVHLKEFDLTPEQWTVLKRLAANDGISQKTLAELADKDQPTVTRILDILERKNLISKKKNVDDRRSFLIHITEKGKNVQQELTPFIEDVFENQILKGIPEEKLEVYKEVLQLINQNMRDRTD
ncbi:MarR family winged helix-turn-helix transcriptional regulator [Rossellomorea marisflavi]|uniref:HTH marR-type domain-containing protein n=1 Tax=Rossellomorea marisflavi TaxID=189381 RepID=A0A0J5T7U3_9BACI|nr:MarR family transcriptional regulator [Rossellomorea marisflavi]KMK91894.1 hypothetical protein VL03_18215 [Rossellomorea marisflavi]KML05129.1 hypothetical protein VL06_12420 [Rossellomorea marisflavi]KML34985.1 hypothetical protein VL12_02130 [Rossellomorea marisflavi]KON83860.1 hypothetical protein AF331_17040 [Rossellomorea marisflavi]KZE53265.1 hypothetical protein AV649_10870 [Rossellomorea marisflavi]